MKSFDKSRLRTSNGYRRLILSMFIGFYLYSPLNAQNITGNVRSETGESLVGVSVQIKGTDKGGITDLDGNFTLAFDAERN
jgi:hypothetical protein